MSNVDDRSDLAPRAEPGVLRAFGLALLVHLLLLTALTWGVNWKSKDQSLSFEAELWSALPQEAAPPLEAPPPPPPEPVAPPAPAPAPAPPPKAEAVPDADIAIEREKKRLAEDKKKAQALADKTEKAKKIEEAKKLAEDKAKAAKQAKLEAKKQAVQKEQLAKKEAVLAAVQRKENLERQNALLGATGGAQASGAALKASGPSATYGSKVRAKVKPNIVFTEDIAGNPVAEVEVRTTLDGTIISQRLVKSSGNKAWDEAVIKAIIRTETMPRDTDGRVPTPMIIEFRPKD
jgi:colicin import membrane protein